MSIIFEGGEFWIESQIVTLANIPDAAGEFQSPNTQLDKQGDLLGVSVTLHLSVGTVTNAQETGCAYIEFESASPSIGLFVSQFRAKGIKNVGTGATNASWNCIFFMRKHHG